MPDWESALAAELSARHHVTTRKRLERLGLGRRVIDRLCGRGRLDHVGKGVLVSSSGPETFEQRLAVACALTGGVICYPTAGEVWDYRNTPRHPNVHVMLAHSRRVHAPEWVVVHRSDELPRCDIVRRRDGIVVTSPPRTAFDAAAWLSPVALESLLEQGIKRGHYTIPTLWGHARRLCCRGRRGSGNFAAVLAAREPWRRPVSSDHELRLERAMRRRGFPPLTREHPLEIAPGGVIHPDLGVPEHGFFVEVDHLSWHGGRFETAYDRWRDLKVRAHTGFHVERVTDIALDHYLEETVEDLRTLWQSILGAASTKSVLSAPKVRR
jgi:hypothetical protein